MKSPGEKSNLGLLLTLGGSIAGWMAGGVFLGHWVELKLGCRPWGAVLGSLLGIAGSGYSVYQAIKSKSD